MADPQSPLDHTTEMLRRLRAETQQGFDKLGRALAELTAETRISYAHIVRLVRFEDYATTKRADLETRLACREAVSTARLRNYLTNS